jgi:cytochrome c553
MRPIVVIAVRMRRATFLALAASSILIGRIDPVAASEESVDRATQLALGLEPHRDPGQRLFAEHCASCHGPEAQGNGAQSVPSLAGQRFRYLVRQLANLGGDQRESRTMHRVLADSAVKNPQSWVDLAAYLNGLEPTQSTMTGKGSNVPLGRGIVHEQCASCHGLDAHGDQDGLVPSLRNQHYSYLSAQIGKLAEGRRHNVDEELVRFLQTFDAKDVDGVADYLSRQRSPVHRNKQMRSDGTVVD